MAKIKKTSTHFTTLENLLSYKYITNSYKLFWYKSLISRGSSKVQEYTLKDLGFEMVLNAWELVVKKEITFGRLDKLHRVIELIATQYNITADVTAEDLRSFFPTITDKEILELLDEVSEEACFEFIAPLFEQKLKKIAYTKRFATIGTLSEENTSTPYQILQDKHKIKLNSDWINYLSRNTKETENLFHDALAFFLDRHAMSKKINRSC